MVKIAGGMKQDGVVIGNAFDKYGSSNPIVRHIVRGFENALTQLVTQIAPSSIHEIGCGEGYWVINWIESGIDARGTDFSSDVIEIAKSNAVEKGVPASRFEVRSIYDVTPERDRADLIVCCEVFEHLQNPNCAFKRIVKLNPENFIISVPSEPLWRFLNIARGKYLYDLGNTPGHIQHWSKSGIVSLVENHFRVERVLSPLPWTMVHCKSM